MNHILQSPNEFAKKDIPEVKILPVILQVILMKYLMPLQPLTREGTCVSNKVNAVTAC